MTRSIDLFYFVLFLFALGVTIKFTFDEKNRIEAFMIDPKHMTSTIGEIIESKTQQGYKYVRRNLIKYSYRVDEKLYFNDAVNFLLSSNQLHQYKKGSLVPVYYSRTNPEISILEPYPRSLSFMLKAAFCLLGAITFLAFAIRKKL